MQSADIFMGPTFKLKHKEIYIFISQNKIL